MLQVVAGDPAAAVADRKMADGCMERLARAYGDGGRVAPVPAHVREQLGRVVRARVTAVCRGVRGR